MRGRRKLRRAKMAAAEGRSADVNWRQAGDKSLLRQELDTAVLIPRRCSPQPIINDRMDFLLPPEEDGLRFLRCRGPTKNK